MNYNNVSQKLLQILNIDNNIDLNEELYRYLGDSINMFKIIKKLNNEFDLNIGMLDLIKQKNIKNLNDFILKALNIEIDEKKIPLNKIQQAYILGQDQIFFEAKNTTHYYFEIEHNIDIDLINETINKLIKRHEILRAYYENDNYLNIVNELDYKVKNIDIDEADLMNYLDESRLESQSKIYKAKELPLYDIRNLNIEGRDKNILIFDLSLIILDGLSLKILAKEFMKLIKKEELDPISIKYENIKLIDKTNNKYLEDKAFWNEKINDFPIGPSIPTKKNTKDINPSKRLKYILDKDEFDSINKFAIKNQVSSNILFIYALFKTVERFSQSVDFSLNITVNGRNNLNQDLSNVVGDFTTNILLDYYGGKMKELTFFEQLQLLRDKLYSYYDHSSFEGVEIIREISKRQKLNKESLMPIVFTSMLYDFDNLSKIDIFYSISQTSQVYLDNQVQKNGDDYIIIWDFMKNIFDENLINSMFDYYKNIIISFVNQEFKIPRIKEENNIEIFKPSDFEMKTLDKLLLDSFKKHSNEIAIKSEGNFITYFDLEKLSEKYLRYINDLDLKKGDYVITKLNKDIDSIALIIALVRMGIVYIPVPNDYPQNRIETIKNSSNAKEIIDINDLDLSKIGNKEIIYPNLNKSDSVYVIYTSGSTGEPKGVEIDHLGVVNTLLDINDRFDIDKENNILGISSLNFDLSIYDIFGTLIAGSSLVLIEDSRNIEEIFNELNHKNIIWNSVPAFMEMLVDYLDKDYKNENLKLVMLSGDWIPVTLPDKIKTYFPNAKVVSLGGATEASIWSINYPIIKVDKNLNSIPYGYSLKNQNMYVLNENLEICPTLVSGEIHIGGIGLAKGYLGDEKRTLASFIEHEKLGRLYKTGDFGRLKKEGYIEFLGRKDSQVKIGGHRVELEEIRFHLNNIEGIKECVILNKNTKIIAYYKGIELSQDKIETKLKKNLPYYMIPKEYINLENFPINTNGKIDYKKLLEYNNSKKEIKKDNLNDIDKNVISLFEEVLEISNINYEDDFFSLGGNSITAQRLRQRIIKDYNVKIPLVDIIRNGQISHVSNFIKNKNNKITKEKDEIKSTKNKTHDLTSIQRAYLNGVNDKFELSSYNAHYYFDITTEISKENMESSINKIIDRHEAFRTVFNKDQTQTILDEHKYYNIDYLDISYLNKEKIDKQIKSLRAELSHKSYDNYDWPLFCIKMRKINEKESVLFVSINLLICDGDSLNIFFLELAKFAKEDINLPKLEYSYIDYIDEYENYKKTNNDLEEDKKYWDEKVKSFSKFPKLPFKKDISLCKNYIAKRKNTIIQREIWQEIKLECKKRRISPSALLLALYSKVLAKWSNQNQALINMTLFERLPFNKEVSNIIGDFTKLAAIQTKIKNQNIWDFALEIESEVLEILDHISVDGDYIIKAIANNNNEIGKAVLPIVFTCILFDYEKNWFDEFGKLNYAISQTPQVLLDNQIIEMNKELNISWDYVEDLFEDITINRMFNEFIYEINTVLKDSKEDKTLEIWKKYNNTKEDIKKDTLHYLFIKNAIKNPKEIAVIDNDISYSYEYLNKESDKVLKYLVDNNCYNNSSKVAVLAERNIKSIIIILGILKAGAAYVPIDIEFPKDRVEYILKDSNCGILLDSTIFDEKIKYIKDYENINYIYNVSSLAYIIYTSGSTGNPKGVLIKHSAACNTIIDINRKINLNKEDKIIGISSLCFDLSVYDLFGTFQKSASLVIVKDQRDMAGIINLVNKHNITIWNSVPVICSLFSEYINNHNIKMTNSIRQFLISGDWIPLQLPNSLYDIFSNSKIFSLGGATEASIWSIYYPIKNIKDDWKSIPYGLPLANQNMYVLDKNKNLCEFNVKGDIYIGGVGLASGYINDPIKTKKAFIYHKTLGMIYKTGDLGRFKEDGYIEFCGREDNQVKIRGHRIELDEINKEILKFCNIDNSVVFINNEDDKFKNNEIKAFVLNNENKDIDVNDLKNRLEAKLPKYMIPKKIIQIPELLLTKNGKVDRKALVQKYISKVKNDISKKEIESDYKDLINIWQEIFELEDINLEDDFFSLGGDSIILMKMIDRINLNYNIEIELEDILESANIKELNSIISSKYIKY